MKKILLALGTIVIVITPVIAVVSCDSTDSTTTSEFSSTTTSSVKVKYDDETQTASIDFGKEELTEANLNKALRVLDKQVIDVRLDHSSTTVVLTLKAANLNDFKDIDIELNMSINTDDKTIDDAILKVTSSATNVKGWQTAFED